LLGLKSRAIARLDGLPVGALLDKRRSPLKKAKRLME
jgi:hypothetical protein